MSNIPSSTLRTLEIKLCSRGDENRLFKFHANNWTEFIFFRNTAFFKKLIADNCIFEVIENASTEQERIVGICYICNQKEQCEKNDRHEFGGLFILPEFQKTGLAQALCTIALTHYFVNDPPKGRIISHIHEENNEPRGLFENRLKFKYIGFEIMPDQVAKISRMKLNADGKLVGDLFKFSSEKFENLPGTLERLKQNKWVLQSSKMTIKINSSLDVITDTDDAISGLYILSQNDQYHFCHFCFSCIQTQLKNIFISKRF